MKIICALTDSSDEDNGPFSNILLNFSTTLSEYDAQLQLASLANFKSLKKFTSYWQLHVTLTHHAKLGSGETQYSGEQTCELTIKTPNRIICM